MKLWFCRFWGVASACCLLGLICMLFLGQASTVASPATAEADRQVIFIISINSAPNEVKAFGFDLLYSKEKMVYEKADKGELVKEGFLLFGVNEISPGRLRVGGVATGDNYIEKGASGELMVIKFKASGDITPTLDITSVKDHMEKWSFSGQTGEPQNATKVLNIRKKKDG